MASSSLHSLSSSVLLMGMAESAIGFPNFFYYVNRTLLVAVLASALRGAIAVAAEKAPFCLAGWRHTQTVESHVTGRLT